MSNNSDHKGHVYLKNMIIIQPTINKATTAHTGSPINIIVLSCTVLSACGTMLSLDPLPYFGPLLSLLIGVGWKSCRDFTKPWILSEKLLDV